MACDGGWLSSTLSCLIQMASCAALASAMYSASAVDKATLVCFLLRQLTAPPPIVNRYPDVDFRSFTSPAQFESEYPSTSSL